MASIALPFEGLPPVWTAIFYVCFAVIVAMCVWTAILFVRGRRAVGRPPPVPADGADGFTWVFLVPALNEEVTIRDSVDRLLSLELARRRVLVIDDASDDGTAEVLASIEHPDLFVLRRRPPEAQKGKAAALNHAYQSLREMPGRDRTIVVIVDADGRLRPDAPAFAAGHFEDPLVGGVQSLVRIYNRDHLLTWFQDVEFSVYGYLFQAGRDDWGTAGMGGNGQFNRLSALDDIADGVGPWKDRLTEDQDLGLRLIERGWKGRQELRAAVDQQGLTKPGRLLHQRTRWSQGNLQAMGLAGSLLRAPFPFGARLEMLLYLFMPVWQGVVGVGLISAVILWLTGTAAIWAGGPTWQLGFFYLLAFGGSILGCVASRCREGKRGYLTGFLIAQVYAPYTWFLWPVLVRSTIRQLRARDDWAKTEREPLEAAGGDQRPHLV